MHAAEIWRYPVKSMGGERLPVAEVTAEGLAGDRRVAVFDRRSRRPEHPLSARDLPQLLGFRARWQAGGPLVEGPGLAATRWDRPQVREHVSMACGRDLELAEEPLGAFDDSALHILGMASVRELASEVGWAVDHRRFRANIYLDGGALEPDSEPAWASRHFQVGSATISVIEGCPRCAITTWDPTTLRPQPGLLRHLVRTRNAVLGVYAAVISPGQVAAGDRLTWL
ncbi:MAG: MOSC domain-containing protein [Candidatus Dormibacteraeota bacterium]|nr:MOSC domain-containing protein [Candidatus Dormibacteraeota bacterium]